MTILPTGGLARLRDRLRVAQARIAAYYSCVVSAMQLTAMLTRARRGTHEALAPHQLLFRLLFD